MASQDGAGRDATEELTQIVRECVRNEIALQRSGSNTSFLMRTRDLIAMILLKGYFELRAGQSESEIRKSITEDWSSDSRSSDQIILILSSESSRIELNSL